MVIDMSTALALRRHLYAEAARARGRRRRALRKQIALLTVRDVPGADDGGSGVREPRRPGPSSSPAAAAAPLPGARSDPDAPARA